MTQKIAVAVVHGIGKQEADFVSQTKTAIERYCQADCGSDIVIEPVYWARLMQDREELLWDRVAAGGPLDFRATRRLMVDFVADALAYQPTDYGRKAYEDIHAAFARTLRRLAEAAGGTAPLCIIAHSLGTVIASNFVYDLQKPQIIPLDVRAAMGDTPLDRGETLTLLYTLGSPLALWSLRFRDFGQPIQVPAPQLADHYPGLEGEWINYYDRDDVIAFPLKTLNAAYAQVVKADVAANVGDMVTHWNPLSHLHYWTDDDIVRPVSKAIIRLWRAINT